MWPGKAQRQEGKWYQISKSPRGQAGERNQLHTWLHPVPQQNSVSHKTLYVGGLSREVCLPSSLLKTAVCLGPWRATQVTQQWASRTQLSPPRKSGDTRWQDGKRAPSPSLPPRGPGVFPSLEGKSAAVPARYEGHTWPGTSPMPHAEPTQPHLTQGKDGARNTDDLALGSSKSGLLVKYVLSTGHLHGRCEPSKPSSRHRPCPGGLVVLTREAGRQEVT